MTYLGIKTGGEGGVPPGQGEISPLRYAITDRTRFAGTEQERQVALLRNAARWAAEGVSFLQLREKDLSAGALAALARALLEALDPRESAPKLLINSRADVAIAVRASGVHLTAAPDELTPAQVRSLYATSGLPEPVVSVSCHTLAEVARARGPEPDRSAATLILFGPVFEKAVTAQPGTGLDLLRQACTLAAPVPVLALGGITASNTATCLAAGAAGIAAIRLFQAPSEPTAPHLTVDLHRASP